MSKHILDIEYRGHEIVILKDELSRLYMVDIRSDNFDGEYMAGFEGFTTDDDALFCAKAYLDGYYLGKRSVKVTA